MYPKNRGDLFPEAYRTAFRVLLDRVPGEEGDKAIEIIERAMGKPSSTIFSYISPLPIGAASIGQVHKAVIASDGRECVIKIQYPNCRQIFQWDIRSAKLVSTYIESEICFLS